MFINAIAHYIPKERVHNSYFESVNGLSDSWIFERTGIKTRSKAGEEENTNTMGIEAVRNLMPIVPFEANTIDLIVGASYSPHDTVATLAHVVQRAFKMNNARAIYVSSACSSLLNALEIIEGYFASGKAQRALLVASEHNTAYSHEECEKSGHLWGDGAAAMLISNERVGKKPGEILTIHTLGLGHVANGPEAVYLTPGKEGLMMPDGREVFINACKYMRSSLESSLQTCNMSIEDLNFIVPHQANHRIIANLSKQLKLNEKQVLSNIQKLGNTGAASTGICLSQHMDEIPEGSHVGLTVFGGGYSAGSTIIKF